VLLGMVMMVISSCNKPEGKGSEQMTSRQHQGVQYPITLVIHGGAGNITRGNLSPDMVRIYQTGLEHALKEGYKILMEGGSSKDAVVAAIRQMEDSPWFNAGKGAVFSHDSTIELDASIMDGGTGLAGAVAGVRTIKNPIVAAYQIMTHSPYVMLIGRGAESFAGEQGLDIVDPGYFQTRRQLERLRRLRLMRENTQPNLSSSGQAGSLHPEEGGFGTVGAVALDRDGNIAAGTSTGGTIDKRSGRVGDTAIIGAGTFAENKTCGISATGHGEYFIRNVVAYDIAARMKYLGQSLKHAAEEVIGQKLKKVGGSGGVIGLDRQGNIMMEFNTPGMYRGYIQEQGRPKVFLFD